jgi:hypothetical protein
MKTLSFSHGSEGLLVIPLNMVLLVQPKKGILKLIDGTQLGGLNPDQMISLLQVMDIPKDQAESIVNE